MKSGGGSSLVIKSGLEPCHGFSILFVASDGNVRSTLQSQTGFKPWLVKEAIVGMRRRIEITVYRRSTIVLYGQSEQRSRNWRSAESERSEQIGARSPEVGTFDQADAQLVTVDVSRSPELKLLIEALVKSDGITTRAPKHPSLSFSNFISKLRGLGFANKQ
jgi:hypothetical protein